MLEKIAIIGSGPAGIYTSLLLKDFPGKVVLFEMNDDIGEKLKTTGGGKMNVTNLQFSENEFFSSHPRATKHFFHPQRTRFLPSILSELDIEYVFHNNRALLKSEDAKKEVLRLKNKLHFQENLELRLSTKVMGILPENGKFVVSYIEKQKEFHLEENFCSVIIATGGMFRHNDMGEEEYIYGIPRKLGHKINKVSPCLSPIAIKYSPFKTLSGISTKATLTNTNEKKSVTDDLLLTHFGISGPAVLDFSMYLDSKPEEFEINFFPNYPEEQCISDIKTFRNGSYSIRYQFKDSAPKRLLDFLIQYAGIDQNEVFGNLSRQDEKRLRDTMYRFKCKDYSVFPYPGCWTTKGGVSLNDVHISNLESKKIPHLFFAGEVLDITGLCGGYNISFAALSAKTVAEAILKKINFQK